MCLPKTAGKNFSVPQKNNSFPLKNRDRLVSICNAKRRNLYLLDLHTNKKEMKNLIILIIATLVFLLPSCQNEPPLYSDKLTNALTGLNKLSLTAKEKGALHSRIRDGTDLTFPVYTPEGERLIPTHIREKEMNMTVDCFGNKAGDIEAVVFRKLTKTAH